MSKKIDTIIINDQVFELVDEDARNGLESKCGTGEGSEVSDPCNTATGDYARAEGLNTKALGDASHAEGESTVARTTGSHAEGMSTEAGRANGQSYAHAEGVSTKAYGRGSHAEGENAEAVGDYSHAEGRMTRTASRGSHSEGDSTVAGNPNATLSNDISELSVYEQQVPGASAHAEGIGSIANKSASHAEGFKTQALGNASHSEGQNTTASATGAHSEGLDTLASGDYSHAEGCSDGSIVTTASGKGSHAEGIGTWALGKGSHSEGIDTTASKDYAHAEGDSTIASGVASHTEGVGTLASGNYQHAQGKYNIEDSANKYAHIVGGGTSDTDRRNIHTLDWQGNATFTGDVVATTPDGETVSLLGFSRNVVTPTSSYNLHAITLEDVDKDNIYNGLSGLSVGDSFKFIPQRPPSTISACNFRYPINEGDMILFTKAHELQSSEPVLIVADANNIVLEKLSYNDVTSNPDYIFEATDSSRTGGAYKFKHSGTLYMTFLYSNIQSGEFFYIKKSSPTEPLVLYEHGYYPDDDTSVGDATMRAIMEGRQVLIRVDNAEDSIHTALYAPIYQYQLPNYQNEYLYLIFLQDFKQDLSSLVGLPEGTLTIPRYAQIKLKTSHTYNQTPLL